MKCKKDQIPSVENFNIINQFCINIKDKRNPLQTIIVLNRNGQNFQLPKNGTVLDPNFNRLNKLLFGPFHIQIGKLYIKALTHQKDDYGSRQKKVNAGRLRNAHYWEWQIARSGRVVVESLFAWVEVGGGEKGGRGGRLAGPGGSIRTRHPRGTAGRNSMSSI